MSVLSGIQIVVFLAALLACAKPLGLYMFRVLSGDCPRFVRFLVPLERIVRKAGGTEPGEEMSWRQYAEAVLSFSCVCFIGTYALQRLQGVLPLNPDQLPNVPPDLAFNTAVSFVTNTNWQSYGGETTLSYLTQMMALTVQNFVSAAAGIAVLVAFARGFSRHESSSIGNYWVDLIRSTIYVLLPLSFVLALILVSQGVVQTSHQLSMRRSSSRRSRRTERESKRRKSLWGRSRPRLRSSSLAPTAVDFSIRTRHTRSKIRRRFRTSCKCWRSC